MFGQLDVDSMSWVTVRPQRVLVEPSGSGLCAALGQYHLSPEAVDFIERHMLMEEKRALLRFLATPQKDGGHTGAFMSLRAFTRLYGRREDLLLSVLSELLFDGIITPHHFPDGEVTYALTDNPSLRAAIDDALAAYYGYPMLRRLLTEHTIG